MSYRRYRARRRGRRSAAILALALACAVGAGAGAQVRNLGGESERAPVVRAGVTAAGTRLSGLTAAEARAVLRDAFQHPLLVRHHGHSWRFAPETLGARPLVRKAVREALAAPAGSTIRLPLRLSGRRLRSWARSFARDFNRPAESAAIALRGLRPRASRERWGRRLEPVATQMRIAAALRAGERAAVRLAVRRVRPRITRRMLGPAIVVLRDSNRLRLYRGGRRRGLRLVRTLRVATGQPAYPTPLGAFSIAMLQRDPWWYPPDSDWAAGAEPLPPGPGNPLGTRWMGLSEPLVGIHGTPDSASIGYSASHGCIRMRLSDAEWLFERVTIGTRVFIVPA